MNYQPQLVGRISRHHQPYKSHTPPFATNLAFGIRFGSSVPLQLKAPHALASRKNHHTTLPPFRAKVYLPSSSWIPGGSFIAGPQDPSCPQSFEAGNPSTFPLICPTFCWVSRLVHLKTNSSRREKADDFSKLVFSLSPWSCKMLESNLHHSQLVPWKLQLRLHIKFRGEAGNKNCWQQMYGGLQTVSQPGYTPHHVLFVTRSSMGNIIALAMFSSVFLCCWEGSRKMQQGEWRCL